MPLDLLIDTFELLTGKSTNKISKRAVSKLKKSKKQEIPYKDGRLILKGDSIIRLRKLGGEETYHLKSRKLSTAYFS
tara:strand:- start:151 stop:381 length:231 start_codon:yes stop_codon:yes gene_type:complete